MAKPRRKKPAIARGMKTQVQGAGMFGSTVQQVLDVRPLPPKRGGASAGDEAVILTYRRDRAGRRTSLGKVTTMPAEEAAELFK